MPKPSGKPTLNLEGGSVRMFGYKKRARNNDHRPDVPGRATKPTPSIDPIIVAMKLRRSSTGAAFGLAYSGLTGIGPTVGFGLAAGATGDSLAAASAFDIGPSLACA